MTGPWIHVLRYDNKDLVVAVQWKHQPVLHQHCRKHQAHLFHQNQDDQNLSAGIILPSNPLPVQSGSRCNTITEFFRAKCAAAFVAYLSVDIGEVIVDGTRVITPGGAVRGGSGIGQMSAFGCSAIIQKSLTKECLIWEIILLNKYGKFTKLFESSIIFQWNEIGMIISTEPEGLIIDNFIAIDVFGTNPDVKYFFLSSAHSRQCRKLTSEWQRNRICCSPITAKLLSVISSRRKEYKISDKWIRPLDLNVWHKMERFRVMLVDANHAPGSKKFDLICTDSSYADFTDEEFPNRRSSAKEAAKLLRILKYNDVSSVAIPVPIIGCESLLVNISRQLKVCFIFIIHH
uniref:Uncharacterized protein n=1 Tax=Wuchereria bancrofti TaxID=6293 RepID=A0A1I8EYQ2_WUCBA